MTGVTCDGGGPRREGGWGRGRRRTESARSRERTEDVTEDVSLE